MPFPFFPLKNTYSGFSISAHKLSSLCSPWPFDSCINHTLLCTCPEPSFRLELEPWSHLIITTSINASLPHQTVTTHGGRDNFLTISPSTTGDGWVSICWMNKAMNGVERKVSGEYISEKNLFFNPCLTKTLPYENPCLRKAPPLHSLFSNH